MSHFYGTLQGSRGEATRCGTKRSGVTTYAAGWGGAIRVYVYHDEDTGEDRFTVHQVSWRGNGYEEEIASGVIGKPANHSTPPRVRRGLSRSKALSA